MPRDSKKHTSSGAVIYRRNNGVLEILVMHRSATNSWHLPKGTQQSGESIEATAVREIKEETGLSVQLGPYIGKLDSTFERGGQTIEKETHYFLAQASDGDLSSHDGEHDMVVYLPLQEALNQLEHRSLYEQEGEVLKLAERAMGS